MQNLEMEDAVESLMGETNDKFERSPAGAAKKKRHLISRRSGGRISISSNVSSLRNIILAVSIGGAAVLLINYYYLNTLGVTSKVKNEYTNDHDHADEDDYSTSGEMMSLEEYTDVDTYAEEYEYFADVDYVDTEEDADTGTIRIEPSLEEDEDTIRSRHPVCFSENMFTNAEAESEEDGLNILNYNDVLKYSLLGKNVTNSVRYNHLCPWMKPRYNCAKSKKQAYGESPVDWKLTLQDGSEQCILWDLVHDLEGPIGVGERLLHRRRSKAKKENGEDEFKERPLIIAMFGNSYMRQIFEALKCSWSNDITYTVMQKNSKLDISIAGLKKRKGAPVRIDELGKMERMPQIWQGGDLCDLEDEHEFYEDVPTPLHCSKSNTYSDNVAVVEFGRKIRFYYLFRPQIYEDLPGVLKEKLDLDPKDVDVLLFNDGQDETIKENSNLLDIFSASGAWQRRLLWPYWSFKETQLRDIGRWFGADNPWITSKPDGHACMPGPPDDEVNLLMYLLYSNSVIREDR